MQKNNIRIVESPRDGWQGIREFIPTIAKAKYLQKILEVGFDIVEIGSFVSPKAIPQLADTENLFSLLDFSTTKSEIMVLSGNKKGFEKAASFEQTDYISFPFSCSPTFLQRNLNITIEEGFNLISDLSDICIKKDKKAMIYIAMAFGNPYEDKWNTELIFEFVRKILSIEELEISLTDVTGIASSETIGRVFGGLKSEFPKKTFGLHLHTNKKESTSKILSAWENGCKQFDTVFGEKGGCPMTGKEMTNNLDTKTLLEFCDTHKIDVNHINRKSLLELEFPFASS